MVQSGFFYAITAFSLARLLPMTGAEGCPSLSCGTKLTLVARLPDHADVCGSDTFDIARTLVNIHGFVSSLG